MSEEIELRLQQSTDAEEVLDALHTSEARELLSAIQTTTSHIDRLVLSHPATQAKINGEAVEIDRHLQISAAVIGLLQAVNGMTAAATLDTASNARAGAGSPIIWRDAAIAATAQALGLTLEDAAKRVDLGDPPPKAGLDRLFEPGPGKRGKK